MSVPRPSFVNGPYLEPLRFETVGESLDKAAERWGDRDALIVVHQRVRLTYTELHARVEALAAAFMGMGLMPGDRVAILSPNGTEWVLTQFATAMVGLVLVNVNPAYRAAELEYALTKVGCRALVTATRFKSSDYVSMIASIAPEAANCMPGQLEAQRVPMLRWLVNLGSERIAGFACFNCLRDAAASVTAEQLAQRRALVQPDDAVNVQFTSGTTGHPKAATLSHFNIVNNGYFVGRALRLSEKDRMCIPVPLYHCFGMVMGNLGCVTHGAAMIYPNDSYDARLTLHAVARERCTVLYGVPTMFIAQLELPEFDGFDLDCLRTGVMAGAPCPVELMKRVMNKMHLAEITVAYGMTETSPVSFQSSVDDSIERRVSTVGRVHPHLQAKIVDVQGRVVPRDAPGELCTRGYSVMRGYWDDPIQTDRAIDAAGWMHTGDLATLDEEGYCRITGRLKDIVIRGGEKLSPPEIEDFLYRHPKVLAVQVFGVPDSQYGEQLCAWIQLRQGKPASVEEIHDFCRGQIAHQKIPHYIRFVSEFPMTVTGKVQKFAMREQMVRELGLQVEKTD